LEHMFLYIASVWISLITVVSVLVATPLHYFRLTSPPPSSVYAPADREIPSTLATSAHVDDRFEEILTQVKNHEGVFQSLNDYEEKLKECGSDCMSKDDYERLVAEVTEECGPFP